MYFKIKEAGEKPAQPIPNSTWDEKAESWVVMINNLEELFNLLDENNPLMLRPGDDDELPSIEIWGDDQ